jgi:hypothetical protein
MIPNYNDTMFIESTIHAVLVVSIIVTLLVLFLFTWLMCNHPQRRHHLWNRFQQLHAKQKKNKSGSNMAHRFSKATKANPNHLAYDNDVQLLHSYIEQRRQSRRDENIVNMASQEVKEWKQIQRDVRIQLTTLNQAVQRLHVKKQQSHMPTLTQID